MALFLDHFSFYFRVLVIGKHPVHTSAYFNSPGFERIKNQAGLNRLIYFCNAMGRIFIHSNKIKVAIL